MSDKLEVGVYQAKTHLPDLLRRVRAGSRFTITQRGHAVAELVPLGADALQSNAAAAGRMRRFMTQGNRPATVHGAVVDIKALIAEGRD